MIHNPSFDYHIPTGILQNHNLHIKKEILQGKTFSQIFEILSIGCLLLLQSSEEWDCFKIPSVVSIHQALHHARTYIMDVIDTREPFPILKWTLSLSNDLYDIKQYVKAWIGEKIKM